MAASPVLVDSSYYIRLAREGRDPLRELAIGFTMALFISSLAFPGSSLANEAKLGIPIGSLVSAAVGMAILLTTQRRAEHDLSPKVAL